MSWMDLVPAGYAAMSQLEKYTRSTVDPTVLHLIKVRASALNGCAFCLDMHVQEALADGEDQRRLFAVAAWREAPFFDERERAALALTDAVTRLGDHGVPDDAWDEAVRRWSEEARPCSEPVVTRSYRPGMLRPRDAVRRVFPEAPHADRVVVTSRHHERPIVVFADRDGPHPPSVTGHRIKQPAVDHVPDPHRPVDAAARGDDTIVPKASHRNRTDPFLVADQSVDNLTGLCVLDPHGPVGASADDDPGSVPFRCQGNAA